MDEYIKRSDMRVVLEKASINPRFADEPPAADVEPVVRCKDCTSCYDYNPGFVCLRWRRSVAPDSYCEMGVLKTKCRAKIDGEVKT